LPIAGAFEGERTGHKMNHCLVTALLADTSAWRIEELTLSKDSNESHASEPELAPHQA
jgi:UDP-3-O-[3-hydroxymyristoyl] N-acetylglucosamine deacetylase